MKIEKQLWGKHGEKDIYLFEINNEQGMVARVSNYGGVLQSLLVKNAAGEMLDVVLGYDTLKEYKNSETFFGAMVGPIADRLGEGRCKLAGKTVQFPINAGPDCMHSADFGFHAQVWDWKILEDGVAFTRDFADGEVGLPGNMRVRLIYRMNGEKSLRLEYAAECDCETALSFTNHSYFTLNGGAGDCRDHVLKLNASRYAQTERECEPICTGRMLEVDGTPFDMRNGVEIDAVLRHVDFPEIRTGGGIDHYFIVDGEGMRAHGELSCRESGLRMICRSDAPGVLVYTANGLENENGKGGAVYGRNWAVCLETERFPNAVNRPQLRAQVVLQPGERYESATEFEFILI